MLLLTQNKRGSQTTLFLLGLIELDILKLKPHPENHRIYASQDLSDLEQSLESHGQFEPITVTKNYKIISGHRRVAAMKNLGWTDVDVRSRILSSREDQISCVT